MTDLSRREMIQGLTAGAAASAAIGVGGVAHASPAPLSPDLNKIKARFKSFSFASQKIGGMFADRMDTNIESRLLQVDEGAILKGYVNPRVPVEGFAGEHGGMFLDAASNVLQHHDDERLKAIADRVAAVLLASQGPDGYLGSYAPGKHLTGFDVWVHKWNISGLLSYYETTGEVKYLTACRNAADLLCRTFGDGPGQRDLVVKGQQQQPPVHPGFSGGEGDLLLNFSNLSATAVLESICRLYRVTGEPRYLNFAKYVVSTYDRPHGPGIVHSILKHGSVMDVSTAHAYSVLANLTGVIDLYRLTGDPELLATVLQAWDNIRLEQLYITGALGRSEWFQPEGQLHSLFASNVGECCATVTWLQLNWQLLCLTGEARFGQEIERAIYNQLLAAQDPQNGDISYFTSMTGHKECRSDMVCCVSNGPRGISLIPQFVWGVQKDAFVVNLYTPGNVHFDMNGVPVNVTSETDFPINGDVSLNISPDSAARFTVRLRVPDWAEHFEVTTDTGVVQGRAGQMLDITKTWQKNSILKIRMDLTVRALPGGPSYSDYIALQRGPQILAMERRLNPDVPYLERTALARAPAEISVTAVEAPVDWPGRQVYEVDGIALKENPSKELAPDGVRLRFVPFADAIEYRIWTSPPKNLPLSIPAVTAFARGWASAQDNRAGPYNNTEALTDENPQTFCIVDPTSPSLAKVIQGVSDKKGDPVWFAVMLEQPETISRIIFRHGPFAENGGWFDTSAGKPRIQITRIPRGRLPWLSRENPALPINESDWVTVATIDAYPDVNGASHSPLTDGQAFEVKLEKHVRIYGVRIIGRPALDNVTCSELSAYS